MVERVVWDHEAAGSKPVTRTRKPAEIMRFQRVFYANCSIFVKRYSLLLAVQDLRRGFGKLEVINAFANISYLLTLYRPHRLGYYNCL